MMMRTLAKKIDTITVAVRAADPLSLAGLTQMLESAPDIRVVTGRPGEQDADADVLVYATDKIDGRVVPVLRRSSVETRRPVVLVVEEITRDQLLLAVECRVVGVLPLAGVSSERLAGSVRTAKGGGGFLPPTLVGDLLDHLRRLQCEVLEEAGLSSSGLTPREIEVVRLMADGLETREIGARLFCSERTVKSVISGIIHRLDLRNRSHVIAHAMRFGVI
jgi:DNA-binding NarL/FixJ family response regulator